VIRGAATSAETRVNPDASLDISRWPRPQYDGPAMRAVTLLRWLRTRWLDAALQANVEALLYSDLEVIRAHSRESGFDIWEEERGVHYYTLRVSAAALWAGAAWFNDHGRPAEAHAWATEADDILRQLEGYWNPEQRYFRSRVLDSGMPSGKELDISVILAAVHVGADGGTGGHTDTHSAHDPRMRATAARLEALFDAAYPINQARPAERGPAMGRYAGDVYFSGGAYYFSTLGVAEFYFQAALRAPDPRPDIERGDRFLRTVRAYTPPGGDLAEQFDQRTGVPRSARHLAWSYAAFISCIAARRRALDLR
jgi:glucoamylase